MTKDRAVNILELQLAWAAIDGRRMDWRKKNYMEALKVAIEALVEKIEEETHEQRRRHHQPGGGREAAGGAR